MINDVLVDLIFFGGIGIILWFWGRSFHHHSRDQVFVPNWILHFSGSQNRTVSSIGLTTQIFAVAFMLWILYLFLAVAPGEARMLLGQRGCFGFAILSYLLARFFGRKSYDYKK